MNDASRWREVAIGIGIAAAAALIASVIVVAVAKPVYRAATHVSIRPRVADLGASEAASRLIRNYAVWVGSEAYASRLSDAERGGLSARDVATRVRAGADPDRLLVTIVAEDSDAARGAGIANALANALVAEVSTPERLSDAERGLEVAVIDLAPTPVEPVWPRPLVILPSAVVLGAVVGGAVMWQWRRPAALRKV